MRDIDTDFMSAVERLVVTVGQDNYGRWFVKATQAGRKLPPIRCLSEAEARERAKRLVTPGRNCKAA